MSRVAKNPVALPKGVTATVDGESVTVKGAKGALTCRCAAACRWCRKGEPCASRSPSATRSR